jgi:hypothetical protein
MIFSFSVGKIQFFCGFFAAFQLSKVVAINVEWLYNVFEHKPDRRIAT